MQTPPCCAAGGLNSPAAAFRWLFLSMAAPFTALNSGVSSSSATFACLAACNSAKHVSSIPGRAY